MKGITKLGLALGVGAAAVGAVWALNKYAPEKVEALRVKLKELASTDVTIAVNGNDDEEAVEEMNAPTYAEETAETEEEWPDLSQLGNTLEGGTDKA